MEKVTQILTQEKNGEHPILNCSHIGYVSSFAFYLCNNSLVSLKLLASGLCCVFILCQIE